MDALQSSSWTPPYCAVVTLDTTNFCYRVCSICEQTLSMDPSSFCYACSKKPCSASTKLVYRVLMSVGTVENVVVVVCFDRAARVIFGCSAGELLELFRACPEAATKAVEILQGEMFKMTLRSSKKGNAEHLRVVEVAPLRAGFCPVIKSLRRIYSATRASSGNISYCP